MSPPAVADGERPAKRRRSEDGTEIANALKTQKLSEAESSEEDSSDDDVGPQIPIATGNGQEPQKKKRRKLPYEKTYIAALPAGSRYAKSLMHRDQLSFVTFTPSTDFLVTTSVDGVVKFWKKTTTSGDVEFVKEFKTHTGEVRSVSASADGRSFATAGADQTVKIFDVMTFDLLATLSLDFVPRCICWVHSKGSLLPLLAVADSSSPAIRIYDGRGQSTEPMQTLSNTHRSSVCAMAYNSRYDCVVSADDGGMIEYWSPSSNYEKPGRDSGIFDFKSSTNLFDFKKAKSAPSSITISPTGERFATVSFPDRKIRIFHFASGKLYRTYDESLSTISDMQQAGTALRNFEGLEFGRRLAIERELEEPQNRPRVNAIFDESGHFLIYGSIFGVKVINTFTNRLVKIYGEDETIRPINLALYQGQPDRKGVVTVSMAASNNPLLQESESRDSVLVATAAARGRFYMFNNESEPSKSTRDIQNEKPTSSTRTGANTTQAKQAAFATAATIHTTFGDISLRLFPEVAPKAVENFTIHSKRGYYNNTIFHRVIRKFMIQTGDPLGDGTGGESIWGKEFADEFSSLKHDKPYTLSMANAGPNTNGSQFFITTEKTPWLDGKHTIFGRAVGGLDVIHKIENVKTFKEKPQDDIKIINISIS